MACADVYFAAYIQTHQQSLLIYKSYKSESTSPRLEIGYSPILGRVSTSIAASVDHQVPCLAVLRAFRDCVEQIAPVMTAVLIAHSIELKQPAHSRVPARKRISAPSGRPMNIKSPDVSITKSTLNNACVCHKPKRGNLRSVRDNTLRTSSMVLPLRIKRSFF